MRRRVSATAGIAVGTALVTVMAGGAAAQPGPDGAAPTEPAPLDWGACADLDPRGDETLECATLTVPMDHDGARSPRAGRPQEEPVVRLALSRVPARGERQGVLVVNPGGPGSPGRAWASITALGLPDDLRDSYDVVGFDPRGTGASTPSVTCDPTYFDPVRPDTVPGDELDETELLDRAGGYAKACGEANGELLEHMRTVDNAHDLEAVRAALGTERIDYLGYSYGSYLGATYATLYPDRVRRLVLDSIVNPDLPWYESNHRQSLALDAAARNFFDWVARNDATYRLGTTGEEVAERYYGLRESLAAEPLEGVLGPTELEGTFIIVAYNSAYWPRLAKALADHVVGTDSAALLAAHERYGESAQDDPGYAVYLATECTDAPWPRSWPIWRADARAVHAQAPFQGWGNTWYNAPCMTWPVEGGEWFQVDGSRVEGALLVQATDDGPTPLAGAHAMRRRFPEGRLVVEEGGVSHGVSFNGNDCVDDVVTAYLREGVLPAAGGGGGGADLTCAALPQPDPAGERGDTDPFGVERRPA
ncbi:alpha/beta hydrolase [Marinactinospora thermotolerans]|uniref:alpha/beta hydrolase n=1 Tax=Marinactinospora thermotolerans TaxID=531310 RepID=UPI003D927040